MSGIQAIVFDLYGTLIDIATNEGEKEVWERLSLYMQYYGANIDGDKLKLDFALERERYLRSRYERYPEVDLEIVFARILKKEGLGNTFLAESCCRLFRLLSRERFELFPDALPVLKEMKSSGYPLAVVSNAQKVFCHEEMRMLYLDQFFPHVVLSTDFGFLKPDPRLFAIACALTGVAPADAVYIGDNPENDVSGPKQIGMQAVLLNRSEKSANPVIKPDICVSSLRKAWEWIKQS